MTGAGDRLALLRLALAVVSKRTLLRVETTFLLETVLATWGFLTTALLALDLPADLAVDLLADLVVDFVADLTGAA